MKRNRIATGWIACGACLFLVLTAGAQELSQMIQQKVTALKESVARNQAALRHYSWIQKTQLSLKGEVKSTKIESCRYGPDGKVQKTQLSEPAEQKKKRGRNLQKTLKELRRQTLTQISEFSVLTI